MHLSSGDLSPLYCSTHTRARIYIKQNIIYLLPYLYVYNARVLRFCINTCYKRANGDVTCDTRVSCRPILGTKTRLFRLMGPAWIVKVITAAGTGLAATIGSTRSHARFDSTVPRGKRFIYKLLNTCTARWSDIYTNILLVCHGPIGTGRPVCGGAVHVPCSYPVA